MTICAYAPKVKKPIRKSPYARAQAREAEYKTALEIIGRHGLIYSADLALYMGIRISKAASILRTLGNRGFLFSERRRSPVSGLGRRYFFMTEKGKNENAKNQDSLG